MYKGFTETIAENSLTLEKKWDIQTQGVFRLSNRRAQRITSPKWIIIKLSKVQNKDPILKVRTKKQGQTAYRSKHIDLSLAILNGYKEWNYFSSLENKQPPKKIINTQVIF